MLHEDLDGTSKTTEYEIQRDADGNVISIESTTTHTDADGGSTEVSATGGNGRIEVEISENTIQAVEYAKEIVDGLADEVIIVPIRGEDGTVTVPEEAVNAIADYGFMTSVSVTDGTRTVTLDNDVMKTLSERHGDVVLSIAETTTDNTTASQWAVVGGTYAINVTLVQDDVQISQLGGTAEIKVEPGYETVFVYYVDDEGGTELLESSYDPDTGVVRFTVEHFSVYMILDKEYRAESDGMWMFVAIGAIAILLAFVLIMRRRDSDG